LEELPEMQDDEEDGPLSKTDETGDFKELEGSNVLKTAERHLDSAIEGVLEAYKINMTAFRQSVNQNYRSATSLNNVSQIKLEGLAKKK